MNLAIIVVATAILVQMLSAAHGQDLDQEVLESEQRVSQAQKELAEAVRRTGEAQRRQSARTERLFYGLCVAAVAIPTLLFGVWICSRKKAIHYAKVVPSRENQPPPDFTGLG